MFNPIKKTYNRILETSEPLDSIDSIPPSVLEDKMRPPKYIYYPSGGKIIKENKNDPKDTEIFTIPGAESPIIGPKNDAVYYIIFDKNIVKESPIGSGQKDYLIRESEKLAYLTLDPKRQILIFTNTDAGTIEMLDLNTNRRTTIYRGLKSPKKFNYNPNSK